MSNFFVDSVDGDDVVDETNIKTDSNEFKTNLDLIIHEFRRSLSGKIVCLGLILMPEIMLLIGINGVKRSEFGDKSRKEGFIVGGICFRRKKGQNNSR